MNPERMLQHFERISEAPDAIPRLRQFILDLAVRGKLVEQDPNDEPAVELLKQIQAEKAEHIKDGKVKREAQLPPVDYTETPFDLPLGWVWARFLEVGTLGRGKSKHRPRNDPVLFEGGTHLFVQTGDVARSKGIIETFTGKYNEVGLAQSAKWPKGTLCITIAANIADSGILSFDACFPDSVVGFIPASMFPNAQYFEYFIRTAKADLLEFAPATAQKNINLEILNAVLIPLPPLAEQHRIVAKVDELMALCDQLEAAKAEREQRRDRLVTASLHRLNSPADTAETDVPDLPARQADAFCDHARFIFNHLPRLTTRPEHIKQLRQAILNLAVRGKLVPQDPNDESAEELLKCLAQTKQQKGIQSHKGAKLQQLNGENDEVPFQIPSNWLWLRIGTLFEVAGGIQKTPLRAPKSNAFPYLGVGNVYRGRIDLTTVKEFELQDGELERWHLEVGDLLIIEGNGSLSEIGRCAVWNGEIENCVHQNHVIRCRPLDLQISPFVLQFLNSPAGTAIMQRLAITSSGL